MTLMLKGFPVTDTSEQAVIQMPTMCLWGPSGSGKTTLAATGPGKKLWFLFDPGGLESVRHRNDILCLDLSGKSYKIVDEFNTDDPFKVRALLNEHPEIQTLVFDSASAYAQLAIEDAVARPAITPKNFTPTLEAPGMAGYGHRNVKILRACTALSRVAMDTNRALIIITHQDAPERDKDGNVTGITMLLGGKTANTLGLRLSEVWHMEVYKDGTRIAVRDCRNYSPCKTRMFDTTTGPEFTWKFNPNTCEGDGIAEWLAQRAAAGYQKIPLPK